MSNYTLRGKVVVVGAGAKNLGGLVSRTFGAENASVVVNYQSASSKTDADDTVKAIETSGGKALAVQGDLTKVAEQEKLFEEAVKRFGGVDIAVNGVGIVLKKAIVETSEAEFDKMFAINTKMACFFIREAAKRMIDIEEWRYPGHGRRRRWRRDDYQVEDQKLIAVHETYCFETGTDLARLISCPLPRRFHTGQLAERLGRADKMTILCEHAREPVELIARTRIVFAMEPVVVFDGPQM